MLQSRDVGPPATVRRHGASIRKSWHRRPVQAQCNSYLDRTYSSRIVDDHTISELTSLTLLARAQAGDDVALEALMGRYRPRLRRWAAGRVPATGRGALDTDDLVQDVLLATLRNLGAFRPKHDGALMAYLRQAVANRVRELARRRQPVQVSDDVDDAVEGHAASPLDSLLGAERLTTYERALAQLSDDERIAVIGRFEMGYSYDALARQTGRPSADAARKAVERAVRRLVSFVADGH